MATKEGRGRYAAICLPPEEARELIRQGAERAVAQPGRFRPFVIPGPVTAEVTFTQPEAADILEHLPMVTRTSGLTITFTQPDLRSAFELFNGLHFLAGRA